MSRFLLYDVVEGCGAEKPVQAKPNTVSMIFRKGVWKCEYCARASNSSCLSDIRPQRRGWDKRESNGRISTYHGRGSLAQVHLLIFFFEVLYTSLGGFESEPYIFFVLGLTEDLEERLLDIVNKVGIFLIVDVSQCTAWNNRRQNGSAESCSADPGLNLVTKHGIYCEN